MMLSKVAVEIVNFVLPVFCNDHVMKLFIFSSFFEWVLLNLRESVSLINAFFSLVINPRFRF